MAASQNKKLTIIVVGNYAQWLINFRGPLLHALVRKGHRVIACAPSASPDVRRQLQRLGARYRHIYLHRGGLDPVKDLISFFNLLRIFMTIKPDVYLGYTIKPIVFGMLAAKLAQVPSLFAMIEGLGYVFSDTAPRKNALKSVVVLLYRLSIRLSHKVFFLNPDDIAYFLENGILSSPRKAVLLNGTGVDIDHYGPRPLPGKLSFLLIARLIVEKGVREYAQAARQIRKKYPQVTFKIAGWLDDYPNIISQRELDRWIGDGDIQFLGRLADVRPAFAESSVFVLPSYYREGVPRTILEAMSMGRPVITTDMPGCRETVTDNHNGFLIPPRNVTALVEAMTFFIDNPDQVAVMGAKSRSLVEHKFDVRQVNRIILKEMKAG